MTNKRDRSNLTTVAIQRPIYEKVKIATETRGMTIQTYINDTLLLNVERDEFLKVYAPYFSSEHVSDNTIFLHDDKLDKTVLIKLKYRDDSTFDDAVQVFCETDNSLECLHVRFAMALPELMQLNLKRSKNVLMGGGKIK